jgi:hypothetical protein
LYYEDFCPVGHEGRLLGFGDGVEVDGDAPYCGYSLPTGGSVTEHYINQHCTQEIST